MFRNLFSLCVIVVSLSTSASAGVMSADHATFGVGSLTRDTVQGLDFLDLTLSVNRSFNDVSSQFGAGGDFEGFRYATEVEVINLINNYGFFPGAVAGGGVIGDGSAGDLSALLALIGATDSIQSPLISMIFAEGLTATIVGSGRRTVQLQSYDFLGSFGGVSNGYDSVFATRILLASSRNTTLGSFLVASSASVVPEPGSITAFAGLLGIGLIVRRRKQHLSNR